MTKAPVPLACTVRGCGRPLTERAHHWTCDRGHAFDKARRGYVNLLQPQDRRSPDAGDSMEAVAARARLLEAGIGQSGVQAVATLLAGRGSLAPRTIVELGCGGGDVLTSTCQSLAATGIGIDLSMAAIERAARRHPGLTWIVANADRRLPLLDHSVDLVVSFHGRRNPHECARVLAPHGCVIVAVPSADDFIELRGAVQGRSVLEDRSDAVLAHYAGSFTLIHRVTTRERHTLDRAQIADALQGTYRGARASHREAIATLDRLEVSVASDIFLFAPGS